MCTTPRNTAYLLFLLLLASAELGTADTWSGESQEGSCQIGRQDTIDMHSSASSALLQVDAASFKQAAEIAKVADTAQGEDVDGQDTDENEKKKTKAKHKKLAAKAKEADESENAAGEEDNEKAEDGEKQANKKKAPQETETPTALASIEKPVAKIAPFGKEDTAKELQEHAAQTQNTLVDAVENAEVAEIKRSVFRALTRLRAAEIKEFDTIARLETQAIDEYNDNHHFRKENPLEYLHADEPHVSQDKLQSFHK